MTDDRERLEVILEAVARVERYASPGREVFINDGSAGLQELEFYILPHPFICGHLDVRFSLQKVHLKNLDSEIEPYKNERGIELIAKSLGIPRPIKNRRIKV